MNTNIRKKDGVAALGGKAANEVEMNPAANLARDVIDVKDVKNRVSSSQSGSGMRSIEIRNMDRENKNSFPVLTEMTEALDINETGRIEAFSDGVFAIAITLLVLAIKVPRASDLGTGGLGSSLLSLWPHYLAFVTSFLTILAMWVNHHRIFTFVQRSDHFFLYWNGLLLLLVTFLPFPTTLLAEYMLHSEGKIAGSVYAGTLIAISIAFKGLWHYAAKNGKLLVKTISITDVKQITMQHRYGPILYFFAFASSFVSTGMSAGLCLCLAVFIVYKGWPTKC